MYWDMLGCVGIRWDMLDAHIKYRRMEVTERAAPGMLKLVCVGIRWDMLGQVGHVGTCWVHTISTEEWK